MKEIFTNPKTEVARHLVLPGSQEDNPFDMTDKRCFRLVFDGYSATEPVIANLTEATGEKVNILSANTKSVIGVDFFHPIAHVV